MPAGSIAGLDVGSCRVPNDLKFSGPVDGSENLIYAAHDVVLTSTGAGQRERTPE